MTSLRSSVGALAVAVVVGCGGGATARAPTDAPTAAGGSAPGTAASLELTIYAAASLANALEELRTAYVGANPGTTLVLSTDSSAALATQIEQGAPADVFLAADTRNPQKLVDGGYADGGAIVFAGNELAVIVPTDNPAGIESPADLAEDGVDIVAAGDEVPITRYALELVANLAAVPGYPADFEAAYAANIASKDENVRAVVGKIELGQGDAGIVYVTDAAASSDVLTIEIPEGANVSASYAGIVVKASSNLAASRAFLDWLAGPDGQAVLATFGFLPPSG